MPDFAPIKIAISARYRRAAGRSASFWDRGIEERVNENVASLISQDENQMISDDVSGSLLCAGYQELRDRRSMQLSGTLDHRF